MKTYGLLIALSLALAFFSGRLAFMVSGENQNDTQERAYINSFLQEVQERISPTYLIDLREEYPHQSYLDLLLPRSLYPADQIWPPNSASCIDILRDRISLSSLKKEDIWDNFRCNLISNLPENFFNSPPYINSNGKSYAYMAFLYWPTRFRNEAWLRKHIQYFHISEIRELGSNLPPVQRFLVELSDFELQYLVNGNRIFMTDKYLVINNGILNFEAFPLKMVFLILGRGGYEILPIHQVAECKYRLDLICITKTKSKVIDRMSESSILIFSAAIIILFVTAGILFNRIRKQNLEEDRKKHALRVLTHELRTPISSLLLQIDRINANQVNLDHDTQERLLRVESDIYRLKHLAEKSRDYLQSDSNEVIRFKWTLLPSVKEYVSSIISEVRLSARDAEITLSEIEDFSVSIDPYWTGICLSNLLDNAIRYGKSPIQVSVAKTNKNIEFSVRDQGQILTKNFQELTKVQQLNSQGMGIGLKIVKKTLKEMGGDLRLTTNPTVFTMILPIKEETNL